MVEWQFPMYVVQTPCCCWNCGNYLCGRQTSCGRQTNIGHPWAPGSGVNISKLILGQTMDLQDWTLNISLNKVRTLNIVWTYFELIESGGHFNLLDLNNQWTNVSIDWTEYEPLPLNLNILWTKYELLLLNLNIVWTKFEFEHSLNILWTEFEQSLNF